MTDRLKRWISKPMPVKRLLAKALGPQAGTTSQVPSKPDELSWRDYTLLLLHVGAELEHALMVQYLYAAWSLGGPQVPPEKQDKVREWQESVLSIAKEEMGHFLTVQNVLCLLGGPIALQREDFPWDSDFYPFPFSFEPMTLEILARYIYAEAPMNWSGPVAEEICQRLGVPMKTAMTDSGELHHVAELYNRLLTIMADPELLSDADFHEIRFAAQGSFAEWARNHGKPEGYEATDWVLNPSPPKNHTAPDRVDMIIEQVATRDQAISALQRVSEQGEGMTLIGERSHFQRFLNIYVEYRLLFPDASLVPYRPVASNPTTLDAGGAAITHPTSRLLASLFDVRYRALLMSVAQSLRLAKQVQQHLVPGARASLLQHSFVEMYNLKALSGLLMRAPLTDEKNATRAGPPFQLPYALELPQLEGDTWAAQLDLLDACETLYGKLADGDQWVSAEFIAAMRNADQSWRQTVVINLERSRAQESIP
jgi:hypothetical protein